MSINILLRNVTRFLVLVLLQVFVFNNIEITSLGVVPVFFVLYIILLPFETPNWLILVVGFMLGLFIDIFSDTLGLNTASTVFISFTRPLILRSLSPRDGYEPGTFPRVHYMGISWFIKYAVLLVFIHQLIYHFLDYFGFEHFGVMLLKILIGTVVSILLIIVSQYIIYRK